MKLLVLYFAVISSCLQRAAGEPVLEGQKLGQMAGFDKDNQRNVFGREDYPYVVYLEVRDKVKNVLGTCGGTIIRGRVVLTAAHCFSDTSGVVDAYAVAGVLHLKVERKRAQVIKMHDYLIHEGYDNYEVKKDQQGMEYIKQFRHDIALVWLKDHFIFNAKVNLIPLMAPNTKLLAKTGFILGWGQTEKGKCSEILRKASLKVVAKSYCESSEKGKLYILDPGMLCTKSDNQKSQQCKGDSGGPFIVDNKLAGIISNSVKVDLTLPNGKKVEITDAAFGAVVTNVEFYNSWITSNINKGPPKDRKHKKKQEMSTWF